jgi:tmRNA-binding protein
MNERKQGKESKGREEIELRKDIMNQIDAIFVNQNGRNEIRCIIFLKKKIVKLFSNLLKGRRKEERRKHTTPEEKERTKVF